MAITQTGTNNNLTENNTKEEQPVCKFHSGIERQQRLERKENQLDGQNYRTIVTEY